MFRKLNLPVLVTIMCFLLLGVIGLVYLNQGYLGNLFKTKIGNSDDIKISRTDYTEAARKTLDWIETQRGEDGWYILERGCDFKTKTCDIVWNNVEGNKDGLIATWARFNFYNQTRDPKDLEIVKKDIDMFYSKYPDGVDNALWICKITYEMYQSKLFDEATKDKLEKICFNSKFPTPEEVKEYWEGGKVAEIENFPSSDKNIWQTWKGYSLVLRGFEANLAYSSDMLARYQWKKDKAYLDLAKRYLEVSEAASGDGKNSDLEANNICLVGLSKLDWYKFGNNDESVLNEVKDFFVTYVNDEGDRKRFQTAICGWLSKEIFEISGNEVFLSGLERNNRALMGNFLDGEGSFSKIVNDQAFFITADGGIDVPYKNVSENGLIVELIRD
mgnify:CR=1 FL=1